jgi:hypothetical protein
VHGRSPLPALRAELPPGSSVLLYNLAIPTDVPIPPPSNARTTLFWGHSDGPIGLADVAVFAEKDAQGAFKRPTLEDFQAELARGRLAGPRDVAATAYDPNSPAKGVFKYGRVAGVARGLRWQGQLFPTAAALPLPGQRVSFPLASVQFNRMGTDQVQSAPLDTRYADTAYKAHGNYGVLYDLSLRLANPESASKSFHLTLSQPVKVEGKGAAKLHYLAPPNRPVMFRGPIALAWVDAAGNRQQRFYHLVLHHGEAPGPFATIEVPPQNTYNVSLTLNYPADSTPPQLLTVEQVR